MMAELRMGAIESRFADMIWQSEPVSSPELVRMAAQELNWKKSTTYTVLKRLCERGIFQNQGSMVTSLISRDEFYAAQSEQFVDETFHGSLPAFLAAFTTRKKLSEEEINELQELIDQSRR
jgi:predicted transcriptional regulator